MISRDLILNVGYTSASLNQPLTLYMYDRDILLNVEVRGYDFRFGATQDNLIGQPNIVKAKTYLKSPSGEIFTYPMIETEIEDNIVKIMINNLMTDDSSEIGQYEVQIQLIDEDGSSVHLHPFKFYVRDLIAKSGNYEFDYGNDSNIQYPEGYVENESVISSNYLNKIENGIDYLYSKNFLLGKEIDGYETEDTTTIGAINELIYKYYELNDCYEYLVEKMNSNLTYDEYRMMTLNYDFTRGVSLLSDNSSEEEDEIETITLINEEYGKYINPGEYYLFRWVVTPNSLYNKFKVEWESSDSSIARVNSTGKVFGVSPGKAIITVRSKKNKNISYSFEVIIGEYKPVTSLILSPIRLSLKVGQTSSISYRLSPENTTQSSISYTIEGDSHCAYIVHDNNTNKFVVTGLSDGACNLIAYCTDNPSKKAICNIKVGNGQFIDDKYLEIEYPEKVELYVDETLKLNYIAQPPNLKVRWSSSDTSVMTVDMYGNIKALKPGFATITCTAVEFERISDSLRFVVRTKPVSTDPGEEEPVEENYYIIIDDYHEIVHLGSEFTLGATTNPRNVELNWNIEYDSIITGIPVTNKSTPLYNDNVFVCTAKNVGSTKITCNFIGDDGETYEDDIIITVIAEEDTISILDPPDTIRKGDTVTLKCAVFPLSLAPKVVWDVNNTNIAIIDNNGVLTAKEEGFIKVTCYISDKPSISNTVSIYIYEEMKDTVCIDTETIPIPPRVGNYFTVRAGTYPEGANIYWSVSDTSKVTIINTNADLPPGVFENKKKASLILKDTGYVELKCHFINDEGEEISDIVKLNILYNNNPIYNLKGDTRIRCYESGKFTINSPNVHESLYTVSCVSENEDILVVDYVDNKKVEYTTKNKGVTDLIFTFKFRDITTTIRRTIEVFPLIPDSVFIIDPGEIDGSLDSFQLEFDYNPVDEPNLNRETYTQKWSIEPITVRDDSASIDDTGLLIPNFGDGTFRIHLTTTILDRLDMKIYEFSTTLDIYIDQYALIVISYPLSTYARNRPIMADGEYIYPIEITKDTATYEVLRRVTDINFNRNSSFNEVTLFEFEKFRKLDSLASMFSGCESLYWIEGIENWNTSNIYDMDYMFSGCKKYIGQDLSNWDVSNVMNMGHMFEGCETMSSLELTEIGKWDTSSVSYMSAMFKDCKNIYSLDISNWNTSDVCDMSFMFCGCENLRELDLSNWNVSSVEYMDFMFDDCICLDSIQFSNWDITNVKSMDFMFSNCESLQELDLSNWISDKKILKSLDATFFGCNELRLLKLYNLHIESANDLLVGCDALYNLDLRNWFFESDLYDNFNYIASLANEYSLRIINLSDWNIKLSGHPKELFKNFKKTYSLDFSNWDTSNVTSFKELFYYFEYLEELKISNWDMSGATDISEMFTYCKSLTELDVANWNTSNIRKMTGVFFHCSSLTELDVSGWDVSNVEIFGPNDVVETEDLDGDGMVAVITYSELSVEGIFSYCTSLTKLDVSEWDTSSATDMSFMFCNCSSLNELDVSKWNTSNVLATTGMFLDCSSLTELDVSDWDVSNVMDMKSMFCKCSSLTELDVSKWNTSNLRRPDTINWYILGENNSIEGILRRGGMFAYCSSLTELDVSKWNTPCMERCSLMFYECNSLISLDLSNWWVNSRSRTYDYMFYNCNSLTEVKVNDLVIHTDPVYMFYNCYSLKRMPDLRISMDYGMQPEGFYKRPVTNVSYMFCNCNSMEGAISGEFFWDNKNITKHDCCFYRCYSLTNIKTIPSDWK